MNHTPGPWVWMDVNQSIPNDANDGRHGYDGLFTGLEGTDDETRVLQAIMPVEDLEIGHPYREMFEQRTTHGSIVIDNPADAHLIAAAPELLAALTDLLAWANIEDDGSGRHSEQALAVAHKARAALAKVEGE